MSFHSFYWFLYLPSKEKEILMSSKYLFKVKIIHLCIFIFWESSETGSRTGLITSQTTKDKAPSNCFHYSLTSILLLDGLSLDSAGMCNLWDCYLRRISRGARSISPSSAFLSITDHKLLMRSLHGTLIFSISLLFLATDEYLKDHFLIKILLTHFLLLLTKSK